MAQPVDFVGLNTFIYEVVGWDASSDIDEFKDINGAGAIRAMMLEQNLIGSNGYPIGGLPVGFITEIYKNYLSYPIELSNTASYFPSLILHRNGPYGFSSWRQIRVGQNPLIRKQIANSIITALGPSEEFNAEHSLGGSRRILPKYGPITLYREPVITSRYFPLSWNVGNQIQTEQNDSYIRKFNIQSSMGNETEGFANDELNKLLGRQIGAENQNYSLLKSYYLGNAIQDIESPIDFFDFLEYRETIFPREQNTYRAFARNRKNFAFNWHSNRISRNTTNSTPFLLTIPKSSIWNLDADDDWETRPVPPNRNEMRVGGGADGNSTGSLGLLQNGYCQLRRKISGPGVANIDKHHTASIFYARRHTYMGDAIYPKAGVAPITTPPIPPTGSVLFFNGIPQFHMFQGQAKWQAGDQAGYFSGSEFVSRPKQPFYNNYDKYCEHIRLKGQNYSLVPSFRMSDHIVDFEASTTIDDNSDIYSITGAFSEGLKDSSNDGFYESYSTTDFLRHFEIIKNDHVNFAEPNKITLSCKAIKKFLPFDGFYPCQRTEQIAEQFYQSYKNNVTVTSSLVTSLPASQFGLQGILQPLFAPGILYNSIKSGVAVDFPIYTATGSLEEASSTGTDESGPTTFYQHFMWGPTGSMYDERIKFETLAFPSEQLAERYLYPNESHPSGNLGNNNLAAGIVGAQWSGKGDNLYVKMVNNFIAEVPKFFLQGKGLTQMASFPQGNPNFGKVGQAAATSGKTFGMRIKMYRTTEGIKDTFLTGTLNELITPPQDFTTGSIFATVNKQRGIYDSRVNPMNTFSMYSRPSAFGPDNSYDENGGDGYKTGVNWPYTPPYYYGEAWLDLFFTPKENKKYTLHEILTQTSASHLRYWTPGPNYPAMLGPLAEVNRKYYNQAAMQLSASIEFLNAGEKVRVANEDTNEISNVYVDAVDQNNARWIIQTKWETPILNFAHLTGAFDNGDSLSFPASSSYGNSQTSRGMWHQYGRIPQSSDEGIFLEITDIPKYWPTIASGAFGDLSQMGASDHQVFSLADLCGFSKEAVRLGEVADRNIVKEAVVAIPYIQENGDKKFFAIDRGTISNIKANLEAGNPISQDHGDSIVNMVKRMKEYVFPPPLDFINYDTVDPFAMYIFEFKQELSKADLADIWQNLPPDIGTTFETQTVSITHDLLSKELLGGNEIPSNIRWMVFKVKQRAKGTNYYDNIAGKQNIGKQKMETLVDAAGKLNVTYNWPYDFFSLVELVKLDAEIEFSEPVETEDPVPKKKKDVTTMPKLFKPKTKKSQVQPGPGGTRSVKSRGGGNRGR